MRHVNKLAQLVLWLSAAAFVLAASAASAQTYPPDVGSLSASVDDTTPAPGSEVELTGRALDSVGEPLQGAEITFTLTSNPGDASFGNGQSSIVATTDENGIANVILNTGSQPGTIVVAVEANGLVTQVTMTTGEPANLPASGGPPPSGDSIEWPLILAASLAVLFVAAGGVRLLRSLRT